jgi:hypothetical protein
VIFSNSWNKDDDDAKQEDANENPKGLVAPFYSKHANVPFDKVEGGFVYRKRSRKINAPPRLPRGALTVTGRPEA